MQKPRFFKTITAQRIPLPVFFPDATRAVLKALDSADIEATKTPGILVNTYHLYSQPGAQTLKEFGGVRPFMSWNGAVISDSGGFQVMSIAKSTGGKNAVTDKGVTFKEPGKEKVLFTPQLSIKVQSAINPDMMVVFDDFTDINASRERARDTVERTITWARVCKEEFAKRDAEVKPYLLAVVQGGNYLDLRKECTQRLAEIGFDGLGYGGWPITKEGNFNYDVARVIRENTPDDYLLFGLGVGKPEEIVGLVDSGWHIFDCVLPTRDARHRRLYVYKADSIDKIDVHEKEFYSYYTPDKQEFYHDQRPVSSACDCLLCTRYSRSYLSHLFRIGDMTAGRLATIHNLRFYSILMEKLRFT